MRRLLIALSAVALLATPVMAQPYGYGTPEYQRDRDYRNDRDDRDYRGDDRRGSDYRRDDRRGMNNRGGNSWRRHVRACSARYRSYNPRTDRYVVRRGVMARCYL